MFSWRKQEVNLDPYFRAVYIMQMVATGAMVSGLYLVWWQGDDPQPLFELLNQSVAKFRDHGLRALLQPLVVMWWICPVILVSALRSVTGVLVQPVAYRKLALVSWLLAVLALVHYYVNFGDELAPNSPLKDGEIGPGFWLTSSSMVILGLLVAMEWVIRKPQPLLVRQKPPVGKVDDARRLWEGDYQTCPHCGMLNEPDARACYHCRNLLFNFKPDA